MTPLRLVLDQNFPTKLVEALAGFMPPDLEMKHVHKIDPDWSQISDRRLIVAAKNRGYDALVTTNHHMLDEPGEVAAMIATKLTVVAVVSMGHDMLRATGAFLLDVPGIRHRVKPGVSN